MSIYIHAISQISNQQPLTNEWFENPIWHQARYIRSIEPDYSPFIAPMAARRMGTVLKRAIATGISALQQVEITIPDAIITGTGLGCIENTEKFLTAMLENNEECLPPTSFMQSTHNTISSQIAIHLKCHGYNNTYSHRGTSFDSALLDAVMQFQLGEIETALVNSHDELTPAYFKLLEKIGYWKAGEVDTDVLRKHDTTGSFGTECAISVCLGAEKKSTSLCKIAGMEMLYQPDQEQLQETYSQLLTQASITPNDIDLVVMSLNGDVENDRCSLSIHRALFPEIPIAWYKHIFGESYSASGLGLMTGATILQQQFLPEHFVYSGKIDFQKSIKHILVHNHFQNKDHSLTLLSCCD